MRFTQLTFLKMTAYVEKLCYVTFDLLDIFLSRSNFVYNLESAFCVIVERSTSTRVSFIYFFRTLLKHYSARN